MKQETGNRIKALQAALPKMRERLSAAIAMLLIAAILMTSSTFAWITLSSAPELTGIETTVAANGSLEIALAHGNEYATPTSGRGDSVARDADSVRANITWGNLVNLSDESYGLQKLELRPALLNTSNLANNPLWGAVYGADGRVTTLNTNYVYSTYDSVTEQKFVVNDLKGVRAISSYTTSQSNAELAEVLAGIDRVKQSVLTAITKVSTQYANHVMSEENIEGLHNLIETYVNGSVSDIVLKLTQDNYSGDAAGETDITPFLGQIYTLYDELYTAMLLEEDALVALANFQRYIDSQNEGAEAYSEVTWSQLAASPANYDAATSTGNVKLKGLTTFVGQVAQAQLDHDQLRDYYQNSQSGSTYTYNNIEQIINRLVSPSTVQINGKTISSLDITAAAGLFNGPRMVLTSGYIKDFEQLAVQSASRINITMSLSVDTSAVPQENELYALAQQLSAMGIQNANLTTSASGSSYTEKSTAESANASLTLSAGLLVAADTYGLAIDLWLRTNDSGCYVILEGAPETEVAEVNVMGTDGSGNPVELYTATIDRGNNTTTPNVDVYKKTVDQADHWYINKTNTEVTIIGDPIQKKETMTTVNGYKGVNRVWTQDDKPLLTEDSTTQGNGSCYVFYADTPEDQARFLRVLKAMGIAFVDREGELLAEAVMDTANAYAEAGKVTVPIVIKNVTMVEKTVTTTDELTGQETSMVSYEALTDTSGNEIYGIMPLEKNVPTFLTAILYLSGDGLGNDDVLSASSIQGQLNLQFGTTPAVKATGNTLLENATHSVSASITSGATTVTYDGQPHAVTVKATVEGENPNRVQAAFQRKINDTQGRRMDTVDFGAANDNGERTAEFSFTAPGEYILNELILDGVSYRLTAPLTVRVEGSAITAAGFSGSASVYTTDNSYSTAVTVSYPTTGAGPSRMRAQFVEANGGNSVSASLSKNGDTWTGNAVFGSSGVYTLQYVEIDGEYYDLENLASTLTLSLGLSARVFTTSATREFYQENTSYAKDMSVQILDNGGSVMENLENVSLIYSRGGSSSDTLTAPLTYNLTTKRYEGQLPITQVGTYSFLRVTIGSNVITSTEGESPVFYLRDSSPVSYDTTSISTYHDSRQYVPLSNNAYIGPVKINNSGTAYISAVVHNSVSNQDYTVTQSSGLSSAGRMVYDAGAWYIYLPTYRDGAGATSQDGTWTVKSISLWDVMDSNNVAHSADNKLIWTDGSGYDFSNLSTTVSSTLKVVMTPGTTALGSSSAAFMTSYPFSTLGASVKVEDNTGFVIPEDVISSIDLVLKYEDNKEMSYGYSVSGYTRTPRVKFNSFSTGDDAWHVSDDFNLQYVGEYKVTGLTVTMKDGTSLTLTPGEGGVPVMYTVTSAAPVADNVGLVVEQKVTTLGKSGDEVIGTFLQSHNPEIEVKPTIRYQDGLGTWQDAVYADFDGIEGATVTLTYKTPGVAPNGGNYTWTGTSAYETVTLDTVAKTDGSGAYTTLGSAAGSSPLLAGAYEISSVTVTKGGSNSILTGADLGEVEEINVYSKSPTVTMSNPVSHLGVTYHPFETNRNAGTANNTTADYSIHLTENEISADGYEATLRFVARKESSSSWRAGAPRVDMALSDISSNFTTAKVTIPNDDAVFSFTPAAMSGVWSYIGDVGGSSQNAGDALTLHYVGDQTITSVEVTDSNGAVFTVPLAHNLVIHQNPEPTAALNTVTVTVEDGGDGEYVKLNVVETQQSGAVVNHTVAASDTSFTVQEGSNLTITAAIVDGETGYDTPEWEMKASSLQNGTNDTQNKPRYEAYTAGSSINGIKRDLTIVKSCHEANAVLTYNHYFWGASYSYYTSGSLTVTRLDTNEVIFSQPALNTNIAKTTGTANPVALPEGTVLKLEYSNVVIKSGTKFVQIQTYVGTSTTSKQKINVSMIYDNTTNDYTATKIGQTATSFTVYLKTGAGELGLNMNLATTSSGAYGAGTSSSAPLQLTYESKQ